MVWFGERVGRTSARQGLTLYSVYPMFVSSTIIIASVLVDCWWCDWIMGTLWNWLANKSLGLQALLVNLQVWCTYLCKLILPFCVIIIILWWKSSKKMGIWNDDGSGDCYWGCWWLDYLWKNVWWREKINDVYWLELKKWRSSISKNIFVSIQPENINE